MVNNRLFQSFLRNYYLTSFFYDFVFAYAVYNLLFSIRGLSVFQISLLLAWWAFTAMIFEIPTGALADSWSRRKMLIIAPLVKALCFAIWFFANGNFYLYALGFLFWSLGSSFVSGTSEALLYDFLASNDKKDEYEKILGRKKFYFNIALATSMIIGGVIANYSLSLTILISIVPLFLSSLFAIFLQEAPKIKSTGEIHYLEYIRIATKEIKASKILLLLFVYLLSISIMGNLEEYDQLYYQLTKLPIIAFGLVGFSWSFLNATASYLAHRLKKNSAIFYLSPLMGALCLFLVAIFPSIPMIAILLFSYLITTPVRVLIEASIQHNIKSDSRATITSASSLFINLFSVVLIILFGLVSRYWGLQAIYFLTAVLLLFFSLWIFVKRKNYGFLRTN